MRRLIAAAAFAFCFALPAFAQVVCGPYAPFGRTKSLNPDGTWDGKSWVVGTNASCEIPDPTNWAHTYLLVFPSQFSYTNGDAMQFVGSAVAYVEGKNNPIGRACRKVLIANASLMDPSGNSYALQYSKAGYAPYQYDQWTTTTPLAADTTYSFSVSGTDPCLNKTQDTLVINAIYQQLPPPPPSGEDGVVISE